MSLYFSICLHMHMSLYVVLHMQSDTCICLYMSSSTFLYVVTIESICRPPSSICLTFYMSLAFYMSLYVYVDLDFVRPGPGALRKYCQPVIASGVACFRAVREFLHLFFFFTLLILTMSANNWQWSE